MSYPEWKGTPNCRSVDSEAFFTNEGTSMYKEIKMLKRICGNCEIQKQCLDYALEHVVNGYWGNTTEAQRSRMRKELNIIGKPLHLNWA